MNINEYMNIHMDKVQYFRNLESSPKTKQCKSPGSEANFWHGLPPEVAML